MRRPWKTAEVTLLNCILNVVGVSIVTGVFRKECLDSNKESRRRGVKRRLGMNGNSKSKRDRMMLIVRVKTHVEEWETLLIYITSVDLSRKFIAALP